MPDLRWEKAVIAEIMSAEEKLTDWEQRFVRDVSAKVGAGRQLTEREIDKLDEIHNDRVLSRGRQ